mgnify:CR=1 FL=1|jgi:hypothetical protein
MKRRLWVAACALVIIGGCAKKTTTTFSQSYRNPGYEQTVFKRLLVIAIAGDPESRKKFEDSLASAIAGQGGTAAPSYTMLPEGEQVSEEQLYEVIQREGVDGVVLTRLLAVEKDSNYTPPKKYSKPRTRYYPAGPGWGYGYGGYYGFYGTTYAQVHEPGYFDTSTTLKLETSLYSVATNDLVWTGQSKTIDPESIDAARASITEAVASKLKSERLIP